MAQTARYLKALRRKYHLGEFKRSSRRRKNRSQSSANGSTTRRSTKDLLAECRGQVKRVRAGLKRPTVNPANPFLVQ